MTSNPKERLSSYLGYAILGTLWLCIYSFTKATFIQAFLYAFGIILGGILFLGMIFAIFFFLAESIGLTKLFKNEALTANDKILVISSVIYFFSLWAGIYNFSHKSTVLESFGESLGVTLIGGWFLAGILFAILQNTKLVDFLEYKTPCHHGIAGGKTRNLCDECKREKIIAEEEYQKRTAEEQRARELRNAAADLKNNEAARLAKSIILSLEELRTLSPQQFEDEIAKMFERLGYKVEQTPYTNDYGRDAILTKGDEKALVECKRYREEGASGRPELQKFHSAIMSDGAQKGFFVTSGIFTKGALEFAKTVPIELVDGQRLLGLMFESKNNSSQDDNYESKCLNCGEVVRHQLRNPVSIICKNGHSVEPSLTIEDVLRASPGAVPKCTKCGTQMRLINGRKGKFWGCSRYPRQCSHELLTIVLYKNPATIIGRIYENTCTSPPRYTG